MKKQINPFQCCKQVEIIAAQFFTLRGSEIRFKTSTKFGNSLAISIFYNQISDENPMIGIDILEHELKYGTDLIYSRVLKECIKKAIELKIYSPPVLVM